MDTIKWTTLSAEEKKARVYAQCEARLKAVIANMEHKLHTEFLTEDQKAAITGVLDRKRQALREGRVF